MSSFQPVAVLTNMMPPYRVPVFKALARIYPHLVIYLDTHRESDRKWEVDHEDLDTRLLGSLSFRRQKVTDAGMDMHIGVGTVAQLVALGARTVVSSELGSRSIGAAVYRTLRPGTRMVLWLGLSEHTESARGPLRRLLRRILFARADSVLVNGESARRYVETFSRRVPVVVAHQAASTEVNLKDGNDSLEKARLRVLLISSEAPRKNTAWAIHALQNWAVAEKTEVELDLAGTYVLSEDDLTCARLLVNQKGFVSPTAMSALYDAADVLLFPTLSDEWGLVVNEALSRSCLAIGSVYSQAVDELIDHGINGWKFDPKDESTFRAALSAASEAFGLKVAPDLARLRAMRESAVATAQRISPSSSANGFATAIELAWN